MFTWTEDPSCATFLMPDGDIQRVYRLYVSTQPFCLGMAHGAVDRVGSNDRHHLMIGSVRLDATHARFSRDPVPVDGAGGSAIV
jgi:hypothetical protein